MLGSGRAAVGGTLMSGDVGNGLLDGGAGGKAIFSCDCQCMSQNFINVVFCIKKKLITIKIQLMTKVCCRQEAIKQWLMPRLSLELAFANR